ncbi:hypothetical protein SE91_29430 [Bradyrhizobium sp. DOA1]|nr:hypothetical protein SE91_29430 [Bradyrhizobium sp. DOA1]
MDRRLLPLSEQDWKHLRDTIDSDEPERSDESSFRWVHPRELTRSGMVETTIVWCQQMTPTENKGFVPDVQGSSIRLVVHHGWKIDQLRITSARLTTIERAKLTIASEHLKRAFDRLDPTWADDFPAEQVLRRLSPVMGLSASEADVAEAKLVAYHRQGFSTIYDDGPLGLAISATIFMAAASGDSIAHRVIFDPVEKKLVRKSAIASACAGLAFQSDPNSKTGKFDFRPDNDAAKLDLLRDPVVLHDLEHAGGGRRRLSGPRVKLRQPAALGADYEPPVQLPPFSFSARSNEFAAVSAYCHCDSMMRLVEEFGFDRTDHFRDISLPLTVDHRAKLLSGPGARDGRGINAYVTPFRGKTAQRPWNVMMLFGLADLADTWKHPLGLAADVRFVWHEFCHVLILAATGSTEFGFAHSAGDALGAIMCDPASKLRGRRRGVTYPYVQLPFRRHDRAVRRGWGWNGALYERPSPTYGLRDPVGYNSEQILSSTLFRLYRAAGGDAVRRDAAGAWEPDLERRRAAAHYAAYLIVRAIASLGAVETEPTNEASQFATALMEADVGTPYFDYEESKRLGGMLHKVVRWAFERHGLYQVAASPQDAPGSPPAVDIYVDDGRHGGYYYRREWWALPTVLWVRHHEDDGAPHEMPRPGETNYVYVVLRNRGSAAAIGATVDVFAAAGDDASTWDVAAGYWQRLQGNKTTLDVPGGGRTKFGPFKWTPQAASRNALLVRATVAGDHSNIDAGSTLPCANGPAAVPDLVRADNNLGYREWTLP